MVRVITAPLHVPYIGSYTYLTGRGACRNDGDKNADGTFHRIDYWQKKKDSGGERAGVSRGHPIKTAYAPPSHNLSGNPRVHQGSDRGANGKRVFAKRRTTLAKRQEMASTSIWGWLTPARPTVRRSWGTRVSLTRTAQKVKFLSSKLTFLSTALTPPCADTQGSTVSSACFTDSRLCGCTTRTHFSL
jgi:hypothetical protein